jgi:hypothetical protein
MRQRLCLFSLLLALALTSVAQKKKVRSTETVAPIAASQIVLAEQFMDKLLVDPAQLQKFTFINQDFLIKSQEIITSIDMQADVKEAAIKEAYEMRSNDYMAILNDDGKKALMQARKSSALFDLLTMRHYLGFNPGQMSEMFSSEVNFIAKQVELEQVPNVSRESLKNQKDVLYAGRIAAIQSKLTPVQTETLKAMEAGGKKKEIPAKSKQSSSRKG